MFVHDFGGDGPNLLMAHATGLHGAVWGPVARHLGSWHCWALDLRGHGDSPVPAGDDLNWSGFGRDVRCVAESLAGPVLGVGHSLGGVAMLMAALDAPHLFSALVLYEPAMRMDTGDLDPELSRLQSRMVAGAAGRRPRFPSRAEALASYAVRQPFAGVQAEALHAYVRHGFRETAGGDVELKCSPAVESRVFAQTHEHDVACRLGGLECPVVVVCGGDTTPQQTQSSDRLTAALSQSVRVIDGADHFGPLAQPSRFAAVVRDEMFLLEDREDLV